MCIKRFVFWSQCIAACIFASSRRSIAFASVVFTCYQKDCRRGISFLHHNSKTFSNAEMKCILSFNRVYQETFDLQSETIFCCKYIEEILFLINWLLISTYFKILYEGGISLEYWRFWSAACLRRNYPINVLGYFGLRLLLRPIIITLLEHPLDSMKDGLFEIF